MPPESQSPVKIAPASTDGAWIAIRALRLHHWSKNLLLFVPAAVADALSPSALLKVCIAFVAFGCAASAHYLMNDLLYKEYDRQDAAKRHRPQVTGQLLPRTAATLAVTLIAVSTVCALWLPTSFRLTLIAYLFMCLAYSLLLK